LLVLPSLSIEPKRDLGKVRTLPSLELTISLTQDANGGNLLPDNAHDPLDQLQILRMEVMNGKAKTARRIACSHEFGLEREIVRHDTMLGQFAEKAI